MVVFLRIHIKDWILSDRIPVEIVLDTILVEVDGDWIMSCTVKSASCSFGSVFICFVYLLERIDNQERKNTSVEPGLSTTAQLLIYT